MKVLDAKRINKKAHDLEKELRQAQATKRAIDAQREKEEQEEIAHLRVEGKKVREACRQFHSWAMKNNIEPNFNMRKMHWWEREQKGWLLLTRDAGEVYFIDANVGVTGYLFVLHGRNFRLATHYTYPSLYSMLDKYLKAVEDDRELGVFSLDTLEDSIAKIVQETGILFD